MLKKGCRIVVSNPKYSGGSTYFLGKVGRLKSLSGRFCVVVLDGEREELGFFEDELTALNA